VEFGLAVNRRWRAQDGQQREDTCFIDCRAYGKQAQTLQQYMHKGNAILIEGRLDYDTWEKDGVKRSKHRVFVERFQFVGAPQGQGQRAPARAAAPAAAAAAAAPEAPVEEFAEPAPPEMDEAGGGNEIPF
jgi:single-strand DNA-binding protein